MNLFELKNKQKDIESDIEYYKKEKERLETKVGLKAVDCTKEKVQSSIVGGGTEEALIELAQISIDLDEAIEKLDNITSLVNNKYNNFKEHNDYDKQIYIEKKLFKWKDAKISSKHNGMSRTQIWNIVNKIESSEQK